MSPGFDASKLSYSRGLLEPRYGMPAATLAALNGPGGPPTYPAPSNAPPPLDRPGTRARGSEHRPENKLLFPEPIGNA